MEHTTDSLIREAVDYYEEKKKTERLMLAYYYMGNVNSDLGDVMQAQDYYLKALTGAQFPNHALRGKIYANLGSIYLFQNLLDAALDYEKKAVEHFTLDRDTTSLGQALRNVGRAYVKREQLDSALVYYTKALSFATKRNQSSIYNDIAALYKRIGNEQKALEYIRSAITTCLQKNTILTYHHNLGDLYRQIGLTDSAFYYLTSSLNAPGIHTRASANLSLAYLEEKRGNWDNYAKYINAHLSLQDSISRMEQSENLQHIQSLYNYEKKEKEIIQSQLAYAKEKQKRIMYGGLALFLLLFLFFYIYRMHTHRIGWNAQRTLWEEKEKEQENRIRDSIKQIDQNNQVIDLLEKQLEYKEEYEESFQTLLAQLKAENKLLKTKATPIDAVDERLVTSPLYQQFCQAEKEISIY